MQDQGVRLIGRQLGDPVQLDPSCFVLAKLVEASDRGGDRFAEAGLAEAGVATGDNHVGAEREVVADEDVLAAAEADRQRLVDAVAAADGQRDAWCDLGLQLQGAEEAGVIRSDGQLDGPDLKSCLVERLDDRSEDLAVGQGKPCRGGGRGGHLVKFAPRDRSSTAMLDQCHGRSPRVKEREQPGKRMPAGRRAQCKSSHLSTGMVRLQGGVFGVEPRPAHENR